MDLITKCGLCKRLFDGVELQGAVHAGGCQILGVLAESHARCQGRVVVEYLQFLPLLAQVNPVNKTKQPSEFLFVPWQPNKQVN